MRNFLYFFLICSYAIQSCVPLNGQYCTPSDLSVDCKEFDKKNKIMYCYHAGCLGAEIRKGKYKRLGNLIILDLIPYEDIKIDRHKILEAKNTINDSINVKFKLVDSSSQEDLIGAYIVFYKNENLNIKTIVSDFEGFAQVKISKKDLPLIIEIQYVGMNTNKFILNESKDLFIKCESLVDGYIQKNRRTGREYYRVKRTKKNKYIFQQVWDKDTWKLDSGWYINPRLYSKIKINK